MNLLNKKLLYFIFFLCIMRPTFSISYFVFGILRGKMRGEDIKRAYQSLWTQIVRKDELPPSRLPQHTLSSGLEHNFSGKFIFFFGEVLSVSNVTSWLVFLVLIHLGHSQRCWNLLLNHFPEWCDVSTLCLVQGARIWARKI